MLMIRIRTRITFLKLCISCDIVPPHIQSSYKNLSGFDHRSKHKLNLFRNRFVKKLLKIELNDAHRTFHRAQNENFHIVSKILNLLPFSVHTKFFRTQESNLFLRFRNENDRIHKKILWLKEKAKKHVNIEPIQYCCLQFGRKISNSTTSSKRSPSNVISVPTQTVEDKITIHIKPSEFTDVVPVSSLYSIRDKWMVNLSTTAIPTEVQYLLQHGENFSLPFFNKEKIVIDLMKNIEGNSKKLDADTQTNFRNRTIHIMNNVSAFLPPDNTVNNRLNKLNKTCNLFVMNNPNIIYSSRQREYNRCSGTQRLYHKNQEYVTRW